MISKVAHQHSEGQGIPTAGQVPQRDPGTEADAAVHLGAGR